ncbi:MAG: PD40 domain-containing protein [Candidatus Aminicenantes bacterium]|nr:MAG: PD40 domain-containing protein [Candidatus Aminicenantes bacterium]
MKRNRNLLPLVLIFTLAIPLFLTGGIDVKDTKLLSQPAISKTHVAFAYAGDLWVAGIDGTGVRRLTSAQGNESGPAFSPDGKLIAFSANYDGNTDVYIVPVEGGVPKRLTWHPIADIVRGFTPDGSAVLFVSPRLNFSRGYTQLYTVPVEGAIPENLKIPAAFKAAYSPDGTKIAYTPLPEAFNQWKHYRGGTVSEIWLCSLSDYSVVKIQQPEGRSNDTDPMWIEEKIYFRSDRNGEFNLFSYDLKSREIKQLTTYSNFPVLNASAGGGKIIYEQAGHLHIFDPNTRQSKKLAIGVAADLLEVRPRYAKGFRFVRSASISPSGARAVLGFRGEIVTVPAEKGDPRKLTNTTGVHERYPIWSPDGKSIAYFSDESGEYALHVRRQDGKEKVKKFKLTGAGFYDLPIWSPDSQKISFADNSWSLYWIDLKTGVSKKIASEQFYGPARFKTIHSTWSPDSKWITYTLNTAAYIQKVYVYSLEKDKSYPLTDGMSEVGDPVFDESGKYLYFFASTNAGPVKHWFAMSSADMRMTKSIYMAVLRKDIPSPLQKESDEEKGVEEKKAPEKKAKPKKEKAKPEKKKAKPEKAFAIDFDGLNNRILALPVSAGVYFNLQAGKEGEIFYLEAPPVSRGPFARETKLKKFDLKKRKTDDVMPGVNFFTVSADKKKILYVSRNSLGIIPSAGKAKPGQGRINTDSIEVRVDPRAEWKQIFYEAWRINRDYFYDPNMHGADWNAMQKKYAAFLPHLSCRSDLNRLIQWMCSELAVGHHRVGGGDFISQPRRVPGGLLGADYSIENGRYRFEKVYGGLNWNPELRSPLTEPGADVKAGEYLLAVQGKELLPPTNFYSLFENTSGKIIELKVGPNPDGKGSRTVSVVPISSEFALRNRDWVEGNLKKVDEATGGRVAYVYVPNTTTLGHIYFKRYFFPQVHKDAIIVDERFNGGGQVADYYIDILRRPFTSYWATRYGDDIRTPSAAIMGPKVMLINELAGSGGDLLPWMFRKFKIGKLIGKRTWGGLVGTLGFPVLMDGGGLTAPNLAIWTENGFVVENVGVPADIEVEQWPADVIAGRDPQLEKAIEVIMEELKKNPPKKIKKPPFPIRVKK